MTQQTNQAALVAVEAKIVDALGFDRVFNINDMHAAAQQAGLLKEYSDAVAACK